MNLTIENFSYKNVRKNVKKDEKSGKKQVKRENQKGKSRKEKGKKQCNIEYRTRNFQYPSTTSWL